MNLRQSISHPELLIGEDGEVYKNGQRLNQIQMHASSIKGPIIAYYHDGKCKHLSVARLVYEAHIKGAKIETSDYIDTLDGDEYNVKASNLTSGPRYRKPAKKVKKESKESRPKESYDCWMNGHGELYC
jgi:PDZ domain-containing secreted protein